MGRLHRRLYSSHPTTPHDHLPPYLDLRKIDHWPFTYKPTWSIDRATILFPLQATSTTYDLELG